MVVVAEVLTMFRDLDQDKATVAEAVKHLIKAAPHQTAIVMHVLAAMAVQTQVVVVAAAARITVQADPESL